MRRRSRGAPARRPEPLAITIRRLHPRDLPDVLKIEGESVPDPWTLGEFQRFLRGRNQVGHVAITDEGLAGYIVWKARKLSLSVMNLAVHPDLRRRAVGSQLVHRLVTGALLGHRRTLRMEIRESNLAGQLFLKACSLRAVKVLHNYYAGTTEDAYVFEFEKGVSACS